MRIKVKKRFVDRITKEMREAGKIYECSKERADELTQAGYAEPVNEKEKIK